MDCERVRNLMAEYIGQDLDDSTKEEVACHLDSCDNCFNETRKIDRTIWDLECDCRASQTPLNFLNGMEENALTSIKHRLDISKIKIPKKIIWTASMVAAVALLVAAFMRFAPLNLRYKAYAAATFGKVYNNDEGTFGKKLNISSTSSGIKVTAAKISADDMSTDIYFEVAGSSYVCYPDFNNLVIKEKAKTWDQISNQQISGLSPYSGGFVLRLNPVENGTNMISLSFSKIDHVLGSQSTVTVDGAWSFEIPVKKINSVSCDINKNYNLDGHNIRFKKLVSGPTGTYLQYECDINNIEKHITRLIECELVSGSRGFQCVTNANYSGNLYNTELFESMYPEGLGKVTLNIKSYMEETNYGTGIKIPVNLRGPFPMHFQFDGDTITIDNFEDDGGNIKFDIIEPSKNRNYYSMNYYFQVGYDSLNHSEASKNYYVVDQNNVEYSYDDVIKNYTKYLKEGKHFQGYITDTAVSFQMPNNKSKYFNMIISSSQDIKKVNKNIILK